ncbi:Bug family tripartite tricarboxylate transporter substrate binding protein [Ectopseudomonas khazarica]|uniref:Bug family tripartite tricarboxylate transporter substrate binding protein n=1 Tax=Ectopseudomonas khazarica TaxID=2502979 RepID=UPI00106E808A|nr:tripartite tricarboxylate transporter substrate binding protein [Pseudomonas khazarica]
MQTSLRTILLTATCLLAGQALADEPRRPECIAPAAPGGGFDLTCKLAQSALLDAKLLSSPMRVTYMPGGGGAVAYNAVASNRNAEPGTIIAFSSGTLLSMAQGKYGRFDETAVRWLVGLGKTYGALAVRSDSPLKNLDDLINALKKDPGKVVIGTSGSVGGQDWMQTALIARAAGVEPGKLRNVAMEGGGELATALLGGHIQVASTDIADSVPHIESGSMRILAVLSDERLPGDVVSSIPTAKEQGYDVTWPVVRGFYVGPQVSDEAYAWWKEAFDQLLASDDFAKLREQRQLYPFAKTGDELNTLVKQQATQYKELAKEFGLVK